MTTGKLPKHKSVYILPNLFTTASLFAGFLVIIWTSKGLYNAAALAVFFSVLMDGLDGKVARLTGTSSEFGIQYDSLSDLVAFGVAPGFLIYSAYLEEYGRLGVAVSFLFAACAALRLARFNVQVNVISKKYFNGLPAPAGGCFMAAWVLFTPYLPEFMHGSPTNIVTLVFGVGIAFLMVSNIRYYSFKEFSAIKAHPFRYMVFAIVLFVLIIIHPKILTFLIFFGYAFSGLVNTFILLPRMNKAANRPHYEHDKRAANTVEGEETPAENSASTQDQTNEKKE